MKKVLLIAAFAIFGLGTVNAQDTSYGAVAGFHSLTISASVGGATESLSASGFYVGGFAEFNVGEKFNIQPEIHFASVSKNSNSTNELVIPILAKYYVSDEFNVQAGPQLDYVLSESNGVNKFGLGLAFGAGYDFTEKIFVSARYSLGLTNRVENAPSGVSNNFNTFQVGLGYRL